MSEQNRLSDGTAMFCEECGDPYREVQRLPGFVGLCPQCSEAVLTGDEQQ
ncbi:hypothetical protein [Haloquadratum walsbyi]|uniref:Uncharacterized protein n=1 Tax=Haloquadratum walsbyi J07HQW2 TaxID=1238425 RepID=U1PP50_9EURY|nr:hypothetical protein [Haloquadratum walsbyi]ERG94071.1 MAG: hypothetical protein J07HQW2_00505 [Haloquadratum walsbyi J07HQW2]